MEDAVFLEKILPTNNAMTADISGGHHRMLRLFGLLFCIFLTLVFPFLAYEMNNGIIVDSIASTTVFFVIIIALFPESNLNKKTQKKCEVLVGDGENLA